MGLTESAVRYYEKVGVLPPIGRSTSGHREFDDAEVQRAARLARIDEEITSWPQGYETIVGPRADAVSTGKMPSHFKIPYF